MIDGLGIATDTHTNIAAPGCVTVTALSLMIGGPGGTVKI